LPAEKKHGKNGSREKHEEHGQATRQAHTPDKKDTTSTNPQPISQEKPTERTDGSAQHIPYSLTHRKS